MPVFIYEPDAFEKMVKIEGEDWIKDIKDSDSCSFQAFLDLWNNQYKKIQDKYSKETLENIRLRQPDGQPVIYGAGGWHRYSVKGTGEICFIEIMCGRDDCKRKAKEQGFAII